LAQVGLSPVATTAPVATATAAPSSGGGSCVANIRGSKKDGAGTGLAGWTIELLQGGQVIKSTTTDKNGNFDFLGLALGDYSFREVQQGGWVSQGATSYSAGLTSCG